MEKMTQQNRDKIFEILLKGGEYEDMVGKAADVLYATNMFWDKSECMVLAERLVRVIIRGM